MANQNIVNKLNQDAEIDRRQRIYYATDRREQLAEALFKTALAVALILLVIGQVAAAMDLAEDDQQVNEMLARCENGKPVLFDGEVLNCKLVAK